MTASIRKIRQYFDSIRNQLVLYCIIFIAVFLIWSWNYFFPLHLHELGASEVDIGLAYTVAIFGYSITCAFGGQLSDRYGRKPLMILGLLIISLASFSLFFISHWIIATVVLSLIFFSDGLFTPACFSALAELSTKKSRGTAYGALELFFTSALFMAAPFGGYFIETYGIQRLFLLSGAGMMAVVLFCYVSFKETVIGKKENHLAKWNGCLKDIFKSSLGVYIVSAVITSFSIGLIMQFYVLYANYFLGMSEVEIAGMFSINTLAGFIASIPAGKLSDKFGRKLCIALGTTVPSALSVLWLFSPNLILALVIYGIIGALAQFSVVSSNAFVADLSPSDFIGTSIGLFTMITGIANSLGPIAGGFLWSVGGPKAPFLISFFLAIIALVPLIYVKRKR